jgi:hypothetical protein
MNTTIVTKTVVPGFARLRCRFVPALPVATR